MIIDLTDNRLDLTDNRLSGYFPKVMKNEKFRTYGRMSLWTFGYVL